MTQVRTGASLGSWDSSHLDGHGPQIAVFYLAGSMGQACEQICWFEVNPGGPALLTSSSLLLCSSEVRSGPLGDTSSLGESPQSTWPDTGLQPLGYL